MTLDCSETVAKFLLSKEICHCPPSLLEKQDAKLMQEFLVLYDELKLEEERQMKRESRKYGRSRNY